MSVGRGTEVQPSSGIFHKLRSLSTRIGVVLGSPAHCYAVLLRVNKWAFSGSLSYLAVRKHPIKFSVNYFLDVSLQTFCFSASCLQPYVFGLVTGLCCN